ncbi:acyltransferase family protein [Cytophaga aurantiaca]|uniref:acyltransferase family protein n=1 Tax=Cytophaga aurantiaca TaxID=29530 RepID=UPI0003A1141D|nr:acyltransferase [Cytophaga aurantiaca]
MRIKGLDTIRLFCACIVVLSHFCFQLFTEEFVSSSLILTGIRGVYNNMFVGVAAVIVFFIISGFCIHYPYANGKPMKPVQFLIQRIIRIGLPAIAALLMFQIYFKVEMQVLWSLVCEVVYYILYPLILMLIKRGKLKQLLLATFLISAIWTILFAFLNGDADGNFHRAGFATTWIIGLPIWLLGVLLAEQFTQHKLPTTDFIVRYINVFRIALWGIATLTSVLRFHFNINFSYTLLPFSFIAYYWLAAEIKYFSTREESKVWAFGGMISYSIYLVHQAVAIIVVDMFKLDLQNLFWVFAVAVIATGALSYLYYLLIERPSHFLAKSIKIDF